MALAVCAAVRCAGDMCDGLACLLPRLRVARSPAHVGVAGVVATDGWLEESSRALRTAFTACAWRVSSSWRPCAISGRRWRQERRRGMELPCWRISVVGWPWRACAASGGRPVQLLPAALLPGAACRLHSLFSNRRNCSNVRGQSQAVFGGAPALTGNGARLGGQPATKRCAGGDQTVCSPPLERPWRGYGLYGASDVLSGGRGVLSSCLCCCSTLQQLCT